MALCECGCGRECRNRFALGHYLRDYSGDYIVEDRGYKTPCHIWQKKINAFGYGNCERGKGKDKRHWMAHVWYWVRKNGPVPLGHELDHLCRQRACVNDEHLEPVTSQVNKQRGDVTPFDPSDVFKIIERYKSGESQHQIAKSLGVRQGTISRILLRKRWSNIATVIKTRSPIKLTREQVDEIVLLCSMGTPQRDAAFFYGIGQSQVSRIVRGESWRD